MFVDVSLLRRSFKVMIKLIAAKTKIIIAAWEQRWHSALVVNTCLSASQKQSVESLNTPPSFGIKIL